MPNQFEGWALGRSDDMPPHAEGPRENPSKWGASVPRRQLQHGQVRPTPTNPCLMIYPNAELQTHLKNAEETNCGGKISILHIYTYSEIQIPFLSAFMQHLYFFYTHIMVSRIKALLVRIRVKHDLTSEYCAFSPQVSFL